MINSPFISLTRMRFYPIMQAINSEPTGYGVAFYDGERLFCMGEALELGRDVTAICITPTQPSIESSWDSSEFSASFAWAYLTSETKIQPKGPELPFLSHPDRTHPDVIYLEQALDVLRYGVTTKNRTAVPTHKINGHSATFDFSLGAPLLTTKFVGGANVFREMRWMLAGESNNNVLREMGCTIWDEWATKDGSLGPVYGAMWRHWPDVRVIDRHEDDIKTTLDQLKGRGFTITAETDDVIVLSREVDQVANVLHQLKNNPNDRRMLITGLNPSFTPYGDLTPIENAEQGQQALPPCHLLYHFQTTPISLNNRRALYAAKHPEHGPLKLVTAAMMNEAGIPEYYLDLNLVQRSADLFLGVPYNRFAAYSMMSVFCKLTNMQIRNFRHDTGDTHIYCNHIEQILFQMEQPIGPRCTAEIEVESLEKIVEATLTVSGYKPGPKIKGDVAV